MAQNSKTAYYTSIPVGICTTTERWLGFYLKEQLEQRGCLTSHSITTSTTSNFHNSGFWSGLSVRISFTNENGWFMKTESRQKGLASLTPFLVCSLILESMKATVDVKRKKKTDFNSSQIFL